MPAFDPIIARQTWRTLEPIHGMIYFAPEATDAYAAIGVTGRTGYFASRAAPMGAVSAEVVVAAFFNFHPDLVRSAMQAAWSSATPEAMCRARLVAADAALRRAGGPWIDSDEVAAAAKLASIAARSAMLASEGRALFAGHAALAWPDEPHLVLWHAQTLLREFRGDGHIALLLSAELTGLDALVLHAASGEVPRRALQATRAWSDDEWEAAIVRLADRDLVDGSGAFTHAGRELRAQIERDTDRLASAPYAVLGPDGCASLRRAARPLAKAIVESGLLAGLGAQPPEA